MQKTQSQTAYAELLIKTGINLQPGQALRIGAELGHAEFVRLLVAAAYQAGARYVHVDWEDTPSQRARLLYSQPEYLDFLPEYEITRHQEMVKDGWPRLSLTGDTFPDIYNDVDPTVMRRVALVRSQKLGFYRDATMADQMQWCVAAVPTPAWAQKVFPELADEAAVQALWPHILTMVRADLPDPVAAWRQHDANLNRVAHFMADQRVRSVRFLDPTPAADGKPSTDLTVGLTDHPLWVAGAAVTPAGIRFLPNMPTEEIFTTPHNQRTSGWVRTSKPCFPFERRVENAWFRFEEGEVVKFGAEVGHDVLEQFMQIPGARRLGEVALVDVRSPVNQTGLIYYDTLFDENAVCHIAFGQAYPGCMEGAVAMSEEERAAAGVNIANTHVDFMIGTPAMHLFGHCADGREVQIMEAGQFMPAVGG